MPRELIIEQGPGGCAKPEKRVGVIVLSRMDSSRLPGKALKSIKGRPMVSYVLERAKLIQGADVVVLATSDREIDDPLCEVARGMGVEVFRGSDRDVAGRVLACALDFNLDAFVRVCGDSPLVDHAMLSEGLNVFVDGRWDMVTNRRPRSFPVGMSMEIVDTSAFSRSYSLMSKDDHFEHVTLYLYENGDEYCIYNVTSGNEAYKNLSVAVDEPGDLAKIEWMIDHMGVDHTVCTGNRLLDIASRYAIEFTNNGMAEV